jgi:hypothetical protein
MQTMYSNFEAQLSNNLADTDCAIRLARSKVLFLVLLYMYHKLLQVGRALTQLYY